MTYAGFDTYAWPGVDAMAWLKANTNLSWCGFYLAPAPSHPDVSWMPRRATLVAQGWGVAPIYVGQETVGPGSHAATADQGSLDGADAASLMLKASFHLDSCCYLDIEAPDPRAYPYVVAWAQALTIGGFRPGVYCSHAEVDYILGQFEEAGLTAPPVWAFKITTTDRHDVGAPFSEEDPTEGADCLVQAWQHDQNAVIEVDGRALLVDLSTSTIADPSQP